MIEALEQAKTAVAALAARAPWARTDAELAELVDGGSLLITQLTAVVAACAHELCTGRGWLPRNAASSAAVWLRDRSKVSVYTGKRWTELGAQMATRPAIADAVTAGAVTPEQARVIAVAIGDLPDTRAPGLVDECETALIGFAATCEPKALRLVGERILDHVAPEVAEETLREKLEREEERARMCRAFTITPNGDGRSRLSGWVDTETAATIRAAIDPLSKPIPEPNGERDPRTAAMRRADALADVCRLALVTDRLPDSGGQRPQVVVTVPFDVLTRQLGAGTLDTGQSVSPTVVRRMACDAFIIPAVMGTTSEVLDLGRARRLFTGAVRRALELRDGGCAFPHCDRPSKWCEGHHIQSWLDNGVTSLNNGVLLCGYHHRTIHHTNWTIRINKHHQPEFIPPTFIDPEQRPQHNIYHRRN